MATLLLTDSNPVVPILPRPVLEDRTREAVERFRKALLTHFELSQELGLDRFQTDRLLHQFGVENPRWTHEIIAEEVASMNELLGPPR